MCSEGKSIRVEGAVVPGAMANLLARGMITLRAFGLPGTSFVVGPDDFTGGVCAERTAVSEAIGAGIARSSRALHYCGENKLTVGAMRAQPSQS